MTPQELEYFRNLLNQMLVDAQRNGDSTLEEMTDSQASYADPSDRATAESDRAFTLRIRDRERKLITKIKEALARRNGDEFIGVGNHEQYFYPDYFNYQPDMADKIYLLGKTLKDYGYRFITADEFE